MGAWIQPPPLMSTGRGVGAVGAWMKLCLPVSAGRGAVVVGMGVGTKPVSTSRAVVVVVPVEAGCG